MAINKVVYGNDTLIDLTDSTVDPDSLLSGKKAYGANGEPIRGTLVVPKVLNDLSDVVITNPTINQGLTFDGTNWVNYGAKIILTYDDEFKGQTITCTQGQTVITKTAPSSGNSVTLYVPTTGNWTISAEYEGDTFYSDPNPVNIIALGTAVMAHISAITIPEGATVLPTDDIQTWLACANITDKSYTTLAEVLADRETFETLLRDSNACDYMARSTSWADNITSATGLIPVMTSNTTPSGTASSTNPQTGREAYRALDGDDSTLSNDLGNTNPPIELTYEFPEKVCIKGIRLKYARIASGKIQALDDNNSWVDLATVTSLSDSTTIQDDYYSLLNNTTSYKKYRVYETASTTSASNAARMMVWSFQLYEDADITHSQDAMALIGKYDYCSYMLRNDSTWNTAINASSYASLIPTNPSGTVTNTNGIIHTAMGNDSVYCVETGDTFTATDGIVDIDFSDFDEGVYTFGSTTAKNPSDLSQDYTKQFRITKSPYGGTTELYLMPDAVKTLYWWGYEGDDLEDCTTANGWYMIFPSSWTAPTRSTTEISMTSSGSGSYGAVGHKNQITCNKFDYIAETTGADSDGRQVALVSDKNSNPTSATDRLVSTNAGLNHYSKSVTSQNCYIRADVWYGRSMKLKALWYE